MNEGGCPGKSSASDEALQLAAEHLERADLFTHGSLEPEKKYGIRRAIVAVKEARGIPCGCGAEYPEAVCVEHGWLQKKEDEMLGLQFQK